MRFMKIGLISVLLLLGAILLPNTEVLAQPVVSCSDTSHTLFITPNSTSSRVGVYCTSADGSEFSDAQQGGGGFDVSVVCAGTASPVTSVTIENGLSSIVVDCSTSVQSYTDPNRGLITVDDNGNIPDPVNIDSAAETASNVKILGDLSIDRPSVLPDTSDANARTNILNLVYIVLGGISLIMIVLQGMRFAYSSGNPDKANQARNGIIYAGVGLTVALTAASLTNLVLDTVFDNTNPDNFVSGSGNIFVSITGILAFVVGVISVIVVIIAGMIMVTSNGDSSKIVKARQAIIYAAIGAIVAATAGPIIMFFLSRLISA